LIILDSSARPGPDPGFAGMTNFLVLCSFAKVSSGDPMMKRFIKQSSCSLLFYSGLFNFTKFLSSRIKKQAVILCYHRVVRGEPDTYSIPGTQIDIQNFRSHIKFLLNNFTVIRISDLIERMKEGEKAFDRNYAVLTFDDGFKEGYTNIFPVLKEFLIPAIFFVSPGNILSGTLSWHDELWHCLNNLNDHTIANLRLEGLDLPITTEKDKLNAYGTLVKTLSARDPQERTSIISNIKVSLGIANHDLSGKRFMLDRENLSEMINSGLVEFGAHSMTHPMLSLCIEKQVEYEVRESKIVLESILGSPVKYLAYPFGQYTSKTIQAVQKCGYKAAVTTNDGLVAPGGDLFVINRVNVFRDDTLESLMTQKMMRLYLKHIFSCIKTK
jgi:peptidoglycan/xylan/chitin deacetylase (PgdA/CDA1 family)